MALQYWGLVIDTLASYYTGIAFESSPEYVYLNSSSEQESPNPSIKCWGTVQQEATVSYTISN